MSGFPACRYGCSPNWVGYHEAVQLHIQGALVAISARLIEGGLPGASDRRIEVVFSSGQHTSTYQFQYPGGISARARVLRDFGVIPGR